MKELIKSNMEKEIIKKEIIRLNNDLIINKNDDKKVLMNRIFINNLIKIYLKK